MKYAKIVTNVVTQVQPNMELGFIEVPDTVVCGMIDNLDGTFSNPIIVKSSDELILEIKDAIQKNLDDNAFALGFEGMSPMDRAAGYAGYVNIYQTQALALCERRANVWGYVDTEFPKVGVSRTMPTAEEFIAEIELAFPLVV